MAIPFLRFSKRDTKPLGIIFHALHKSASMYLYQLMFRLAREKRIRVFSSNHPVPDDHLLTTEIQCSFCLGPQRTFQREPAGFSKRLDLRRIFQLRDPRDILVSQYYSFGWSHSENHFDPDELDARERIRSMSLDEYVLDETDALRRLKNHLKPLLAQPPREPDVVVHYEQMVTDFRGWLMKVIKPFQFSRFGLRSERVIVAKYAFKYRKEFQPDRTPNAHKRNVMPGDHQRQLKPETIERLNEELEVFLRQFGYLENAESKRA